MSFEQVKEFNETFGVKLRDKAAVRVPEAKLRFGLIKEEFKELLDAIESCDIVELADALGDIKVVVIGAAQVFGISDYVQMLHIKITDEFPFEETAGEENELLTAEGQEEVLHDLGQSILTNNIDSVATDLASILAIVDLTAESYSIDLPAVIKAIHRSNMTKLGEDGYPIFRESDGKVMKGPNYRTPTEDIENILFRDTNDTDSEN